MEIPPEDLENEPLQRSNSVNVIDRGWYQIYNSNPNVTVQIINENKSPESNRSVTSLRVKKLVAGFGIGLGMVLGLSAGSIPPPYDLAAIFSCLASVGVGFVSGVSYNISAHPSKYTSPMEMLAHFKEDTEPKNTVYRYFKNKFGTKRKSALESALNKSKRFANSGTPTQEELDDVYLGREF
jgi:hypothetical protein